MSYPGNIIQYIAIRRNSYKIIAGRQCGLTTFIGGCYAAVGQNPQQKGALDIGASSWRELLGRIIADPQEKQPIVNELSINPITLNRWIKGEVISR